MNQEEQQTLETNEVDETIQQVERLYRTVTGKDAPPATETAYAPIPAEEDPARYVEQHLNRLYDMLGEETLQPRPTPPWTPALSVWQSDREILVCLDLPGVTRDQVQVHVAGSMLTVTGERTAPRDGEFRPYMVERGVGKFHRMIPIPVPLTGAEPNVRLHDGVLEFRIPKPAEEPKNVPVR